MSPKVVSLLKGQSVLSRATSEPLPDNVSVAKHDNEFGKAPCMGVPNMHLQGCVLYEKTAFGLRCRLCVEPACTLDM